MFNNLKKILFKLMSINLFKLEIHSKYIGKKNRFSKYVGITSDSKIGNYNYFGKGAKINNTIIGNYCSIAPNVICGVSEHSKEFLTTYQPLAKKIINFKLNSKITKIGSDVWIGTNAVIKQGVVVGNGAIIGANSVVTRDVPQYGIVAGAPAKIINYRFNENKIHILLKSEWYKKNEKEAFAILTEINKDRLCNNEN